MLILRNKERLGGHLGHGPVGVDLRHVVPLQQRHHRDDPSGEEDRAAEEGRVEAGHARRRLVGGARLARHTAQAVGLRSTASVERTVGLPGFPNVLMLIGPHSPFGNQSLFAISENQQNFAMRIINRWRSGQIDAMWPTPEATDRFNAEVTAGLPNTVWATGCQSWYLGKDGLPQAWPWMPERHKALLGEPEAGDWEMVPGPAAREETVPA